MQIRKTDLSAPVLVEDPPVIIPEALTHVLAVFVYLGTVRRPADIQEAITQTAGSRGKGPRPDPVLLF